MPFYDALLLAHTILGKVLLSWLGFGADISGFLSHQAFQFLKILQAQLTGFGEMSHQRTSGSAERFQEFVYQSMMSRFLGD